MVDTSFNKISKARRLIIEGKIIRIYGSAPGKERFSVNGENDNYDVVFDTRKNIWTCSCPNIKGVACYHIMGCTILTNRFYAEDTNRPTMNNDIPN